MVITPRLILNGEIWVESARVSALLDWAVSGRDQFRRHIVDNLRLNRERSHYAMLYSIHLANVRCYNIISTAYAYWTQCHYDKSIVRRAIREHYVSKPIPVLLRRQLGRVHNQLHLQPAIRLHLHRCRLLHDAERKETVTFIVKSRCNWFSMSSTTYSAVCI